MYTVAAFVTIICGLSFIFLFSSDREGFTVFTFRIVSVLFEVFRNRSQ